MIHSAGDRPWRRLSNVPSDSIRDGDCCSLDSHVPDEATVEETTVIEYLRSHSEEIDLAGEIGQWRDGLIR